jgi:hypothetical protein
LTGEGKLAWLHIWFVDYKKAFDKVNTVKLFEVIHNEREPKQILTHMFNTHEYNKISMKINNETDKLENYQLRNSTWMWHIAFLLHNSREISHKRLATSTYKST